MAYMGWPIYLWPICSRSLYAYGLYSYGLYSYDMELTFNILNQLSFAIYTYGLCSHDLYRLACIGMADIVIVCILMAYMVRSI